MATKYLQSFPKPLLDDLIAGRWLPIVGAGFSRNAVLPQGKAMPLWTDLGEALGRDLKRLRRIDNARCHFCLRTRIQSTEAD
jgi:hypothetical protein